MSLQEKLDAFKARFESGGPPWNATPETIALMHRATKEMRQSGLAERALRIGDRAPSFTLSDETGKPVSSRELLARGPLVLTFFRGAW